MEDSHVTDSRVRVDIVMSMIAKLRHESSLYHTSGALDHPGDSSSCGIYEAVANTEM